MKKNRKKISLSDKCYLLLIEEFATNSKITQPTSKIYAEILGIHEETIARCKRRLISEGYLEYSKPGTT